MNLVVTGSTSFIGATFIERMLSLGHRVYAVARPGSPRAEKLSGMAGDLHVVSLDLCEIKKIRQLLGGTCEAFFHLGWDGSGSAGRSDADIQRRNADWSMDALESAAALGCRKFVFSGSQAEYGSCRYVMKEDAALAPVSEYGKAKALFGRRAAKSVESWIKEGLPIHYIHARIFSVYGPGDHPWSLVESCLKSFLAGERLLLGECDQLWNFLYLEDLVSALEALLDYQPPQAGAEVFNIAGEESATRPLRAYVEDINRICGGRGAPVYGRRPPNAEGPVNLIPDIEKIKAATGWAPKVDFEVGIRKMISARRTSVSR